MKTFQPKRWWGITYINSDLVMPDTIRETRKAAQEACCDKRYQYRKNSSDWRSEWDSWKKAGCKAVRVIVQREA